MLSVLGSGATPGGPKIRTNSRSRIDKLDSNKIMAPRNIKNLIYPESLRSLI
jgi:hypothetical protein